MNQPKAPARPSSAQAKQAQNIDRPAPGARINQPRKDGARVGFLFNHDELHQVAHTAPLIPALHRLAPEVQIEVWISSKEQGDAVRQHLGHSDLGGNQLGQSDLEQAGAVSFYQLQSSPSADLAQKLTGSLAPLGRIGRLAKNADRLNQLDALIVPETTSTLLKTRFGADKVKLIFLPHGAGDRSISISPEMAHFDYILMPGPKTQKRMIEHGIATKQNSALIGYPKFDSPALAKDKIIFSNGRPSVFYNPHFDPILSSWHDMGHDILHYFAEQSRFNLILAPHVMLFRRRVLASVEHRRLRWRRAIPERFLSLPHIHIDTGSPNCVDMTYTRQADIYLGDVSSQIYEFIQQPRPAIFLNSHNADWRDNPNYEFWNLGQVIGSVAQLEPALDKALPLDKEMEARQKAAYQRTFDIDPKTPSSQRAASAIIGFLGQQELVASQ